AKDVRSPRISRHQVRYAVVVDVTCHNRRVVKRLLRVQVDFGSERPIAVAAVNGYRIERSHHSELSISVEISRGNESAPNRGARVRNGPKRAVTASQPHRGASQS